MMNRLRVLFYQYTFVKSATSVFHSRFNIICGNPCLPVQTGPRVGRQVRNLRHILISFSAPSVCKPFLCQDKFTSSDQSHPRSIHASASRPYFKLSSTFL